MKSRAPETLDTDDGVKWPFDGAGPPASADAPFAECLGCSSPSKCAYEGCSIRAKAAPAPDVPREVTPAEHATLQAALRRSTKRIDAPAPDVDALSKRLQKQCPGCHDWPEPCTVCQSVSALVSLQEQVARLERALNKYRTPVSAAELAKLITPPDL